MRLNVQDRSFKRVPPKLRVHVWTPAGYLYAGLLELDEHGDRDIFCGFQYEQSYLDNPLSHPLDPINLPLSKRRFTSTSPNVTVGAIFDAAPDAWGRKVAQAALPADQQHMLYRGAMLRGADGIGALLITLDREHSQEELLAIVRGSLQERPSISQIESAASAARQLEMTGEIESGLESMLAGSWTIGGARPKAILRNDRPGAAQGSSFIAKFSSLGDHLSRVRIEFATMRLARAMGLNVPDHEIHEVKTEYGIEPALVLERFDRGFDESGMSRRHYLSAISLVSATPQSKFLDSRFDVATFSWSKLIEISARVADKPSYAKAEMFARLCFNAAVGNTDDHMKNFGFLKAPGSRTNYELAPVFDVSPQPSAGHYLNCTQLGRHYTLDQVLGEARALGISSAVAKEVGERIAQAMLSLNDFFDEAGMPAASRKAASLWISRNTGGMEVQRNIPTATPHRG